MMTSDPRSNYRREKCKDKLYAFTLDNADVWVEFEDKDDDDALNTSPPADGTAGTDDVRVIATAKVLKIELFRVKKEKTAGHLSELVEQTHN